MEKFKTTNKLKMSLGALIIMIFAFNNGINAEKQGKFCEGIEKKNDTCPKNFNILTEYDKPDHEWKLNFEVFQRFI